MFFEYFNTIRVRMQFEWHSLSWKSNVWSMLKVWSWYQCLECYVVKTKIEITSNRHSLQINVIPGSFPIAFYPFGYTITKLNLCYIRHHSTSGVKVVLYISHTYPFSHILFSAQVIYPASRQFMSVYNAVTQREHNAGSQCWPSL